MDNQDTFVQAIKSLGAIEIAPGYYGWKALSCWKVFSERNLRTALAVMATLPKPGFKHVLALELERAGITEMRPWWTPEHRFRWRSSKGFYYYHAERAAAYNATERTTVDLNTGEEVSA